ncbi:hypothetical protein [Desulfoscipio gibsoniae]|uniref:Carboxypeptidase regulatory-like domain-containing protein n=1 Tax=Desulfoscipio gibsoniae DSM 7213 TaxID=767817 RepID=R4KBJ4_9FIRM|nr:hypothetical protein [Desulfoscipio gibsoniae]AGL00528.1 hypothetical protein Desgi_0988 [Desulfoscipio gibsoniae DSM 7213]
MAWVPGFVEFTTSIEQQDYFEGNIQITKVNEIVFHGVVTDGNEKKPVSGALVKVFARLSDNKELPLSHSFSGNDGHYLLYVDRGIIPDGTTAIIVRVSAGNPASGTD